MENWTNRKEKRLLPSFFPFLPSPHLFGEKRKKKWIEACSHKFYSIPLPKEQMRIGKIVSYKTKRSQISSRVRVLLNKV